MGSNGKKEAKEIRKASNAQVAFQQEALEYLKSTEAIPQEFRESAIRELGALFVDGEAFDQERLVEQAQGSPLYDALLGTLDTSQEALRRQGIASGQAGSTDLEAALVRDSSQLQQQALLESYNQQVGLEQANIAGLQGLAGLPSLAPAIAQQTSAIGATKASGIIGAQQAQTSAQNARTQTILGGIGLGGQGVATGLSFSDSRLKKRVQATGRTLGGFTLYTWEWNNTARKLFGLFGTASGVMAHEVKKQRPELVHHIDGYDCVQYGGLNGV